MKKIVGKIGLIGMTVVMMSGCFSGPKPLPQVDYKSCKTNAEFFSKIGLKHNFVVTIKGYSYVQEAGRNDWGNLNDYRSAEIEQTMKRFCESRGGIFSSELKEGYVTTPAYIRTSDPKHRTFKEIFDRKQCVIDGDKSFLIDNSTNVKRNYLTVHDYESEQQDVMMYMQKAKNL